MHNCPTCSLQEANKNLDPLCEGDRQWTVFLSTSVAIFLSGFVILFTQQRCRDLYEMWRRMKRSAKLNNVTQSNDDTAKRQRYWKLEMNDWGNNIISGKTKMGKTIVTVIFLCSIASLILYCFDTQKSSYVESCTPFKKSLSMQIDLGLNIIFFVYFILRFATSQHKDHFWLSLHTFADIFTIPSSFVAFYLDRSWIGFRFLRSLPMMNTSDILQYMDVIERPRTIRITKLASTFIAVWFAAAGLVHLVENSGDFFCNYCNAQELDLFNAVYFMIVTMATVGYGDISCKTYIGKFFVLLFLMGGLAVFATMIPEFYTLFGAKNPYAGRYKRVKGKRHVILCGHITSHSLRVFLRDFLHKGRDQADKLDVLIIDRKTPDIEMEALLKRYYTKVHYFVGSIMNIVDLQRIQVDKATACLIIANKECPDSDSDDSANIMRVISLKNFNQRIRIIIQLLDYCNKMNVISIPGWNTDEDETICIAELKLGLIGMSCVVPGFSTMITNLFRMSSYNALNIQRKFPACFSTNHNPYECTQEWPWRDLYHRGAGMEMYLEEMSPSFYGKTYTESALICFKLRVMLLAVEMKRTDENGHSRMIIDVVPCDDCVIGSGCRAFVVGLSSEDASRVKYYCSVCYPSLEKLTIAQLRSMRKCVHLVEADTLKNEERRLPDREYSIIPLLDADVAKPLLPMKLTKKGSKCFTRGEIEFHDDVSSFDSTGMFYYTRPQKIEDVTLDSNVLRATRASMRNKRTTQDPPTFPKHPLQFKDHVIVCLYADKSSSSIGLQNFVMPLRASSFRRHELPIIIFITELDYIRKEWDMLATFPDIYILNGSPTNPYNLKLVSIHDCRQCVIISRLNLGNADKYLVDKSSVLCALSVRQIEMKSAGFISAFSLVRKSKIDFDIAEFNQAHPNRISTLTTLTIDSNVQYVEQGHTDEADLQFFLTTPFASGSAFADSVLDCIMSCAFYNDNAVDLLRNILMGGIDLQLEENLVEGKRFAPCDTPETLRKRNRARVAMVEIRDLIPDIDSRSAAVTFDTLFCESLEHHGMIVMGIYRLLDVLRQNDPDSHDIISSNSPKRIVIYYPPYNYHMHSSDLVYVMQHSHLKIDSYFSDGVTPHVDV